MSDSFSSGVAAFTTSTAIHGLIKACVSNELSKVTGRFASDLSAGVGSYVDSAGIFR
jgi:hypothetical protein